MGRIIFYGLMLNLFLLSGVITIYALHLPEGLAWWFGSVELASLFFVVLAIEAEYIGKQKEIKQNSTMNKDAFE